MLGGRGIGKTYGCKQEALNNYFHKQKQFIYLRRYKEEIKPLKNGKFFEAISYEYPDYEFRVHGELAQCRAAESNDKWETMGYLINLSTALTKKSVDYSQVNMIIYDEFIIPKGYIRYLPNEVESFLDFYETVDRMRDEVKVYFISNAISQFNPYFSYFKIKAPEVGKFYKDKHLVVQMCDMQEFINKKKQTRFGQLIDGTRYGRYAIDNEFYLDSETFIGTKPATAKYYCTILYRNKKFGIWADYRNGVFYVNNQVDNSFKIEYALTDEDHNENAFYTKIKKPIQLKNVAMAYGYGKLMFENQEIKGYMLEVMEMLK